VITKLKLQGKETILSNIKNVQQTHVDVKAIATMVKDDLTTKCKKMTIELPEIGNLDLKTNSTSENNGRGSYDNTCICEVGDAYIEDPTFKRDPKLWPALKKKQEALAHEIYLHARDKLNHQLHPERHPPPHQMLLLVKGAPGTGKTTLMKEIKRRVAVYARRIHHQQVLLTSNFDSSFNLIFSQLLSRLLPLTIIYVLS
jgi:hypothetical protein